MESGKVDCIISIDVDGTLIPNLIDFESLRKRIRSLLKTSDPLKPLGARLAMLPLPEDLKRVAWDIIEEAEVESVNRINIEDIADNVRSIHRVKEAGFKVAIVTARSNKSLELILDKLDIRKYVDIYITRDIYPERKTQLRYLKTMSRKVVFIGDSVYDEEASRELDIGFIKVNTYRDLPVAVEKAISACSET